MFQKGRRLSVPDGHDGHLRYCAKPRIGILRGGCGTTSGPFQPRPAERRDSSGRLRGEDQPTHGPTPMRTIERPAAPEQLDTAEQIDRVLTDAGARTHRFIARHPKKLAAAISVALAGFGVTAFGLAPLMPDPADLPQRLITEDITPPGVASQIEALAEHELQLYRNDLTRSSDTADTLLRRLGVDDPQAAAFLRTDPVGKKVLEGRSGKMVQVRTA